MVKKSKHTNKEPDTSSIDRHAKGDSFKTPENYFDEFSSNIVSMTKDMPVKPGNPPGYQKLVSRPWAMVAAAAAIIGIVLMSVFYFTNNSQQQPDNIHPDRGLVQTDTNEVRHRQETDDSSRQVIAEKSKKATKELSDKDPAKAKQERPEKAQKENQHAEETAIAQKAKEDKQINEQENKEKKYPTQEPEPQFAENQNQTGRQNHSGGISQQGSGTGKTSNEEVAIASEQISKEFDFYNDTCISSPSWFYLPSVPKGYKIKWRGKANKDSLLIEESGLYTAILTNSDNDTISTPEFEVRYLPEPDVKLRRQYKVCINKNLKLDPGFYDEKYDFMWSDGVESPVNFVSEISASTKHYSLEITGCKTYEYQTIVIFESCDLTIPNVITPNGDGMNDYFKIEGLENYPGSKLIILDRNGKELFVDENYQNDFDGGNLPQGSYFYILQVNDKHQTTKKGNLNIIF
ncbi:MAG: gliding motility-associated C-terminal domain-containing protein [Bacteroidales bacterium]|nr:gliding motility-associated C-terminal domain-containing protein [Bacteroidales bacterium]